jgi:protein O-mannosyl-transferase
MNPLNKRKANTQRSRLGRVLLLVALVLTLAVYWPGLTGQWFFDDYPNIVDNHGVQPHNASVPSLVNAALSSPSSEFKRPLASLSFAANYLFTGLNPCWMKLTNLVIHLLNGLLVFLLSRELLSAAIALKWRDDSQEPSAVAPRLSPKERTTQIELNAALIATGWMLLPINLTAVLYVVQRMESMANLFVLLGLIGYVTSRQRMLEINQSGARLSPSPVDHANSERWGGLMQCAASIIVPTAAGLLAKETAAMLPLYALLIEWVLFRFRNPSGKSDLGVTTLFLLVLFLPMVIGLTWLIPGLLNPQTWATRDFTLSTRLLSEARIVTNYIAWTLLPTPQDLSFYHDNFRISTGLLTPWTTLASISVLAGLIATTLALRSRLPLVALGIGLFLACHLLTGTIIPLELIYEHRNYFASFGLLLAVVPLLSAIAPMSSAESMPLVLPRRVLLVGLLLLWGSETAITSIAWGNPLHLAETLASRAPDSPRAEYELGRTYIIYSNYDPDSPFTKLAYTPLERAAALPGASILAEQALIFMNSRMKLPLKDAWWDSLIAKLKAHKPTVQDESSLAALTKCAREHSCDLSKGRMMEAFMAALSHPNPDARLLANYGDYAWNILDDKVLGERMTEEAIKADPNEPAYRITQIRMLAAQGQKVDAIEALRKLESLNIGGRLNSDLTGLRALPGLQ